jgi:hypothetical protein
MTEVMQFTDAGLQAFVAWLATHQAGQVPPEDLLSSPSFVQPFYEVSLDETRSFSSRYEFGAYLVEKFGTGRQELLLASGSDSMWAWVTALYFEQLGAKKKREEHYVVKRKGPPRPLVYRHGARTAYELVAIHGEEALLCLSGPMKTFGEFTEQLASRQTVVRNRAYFRAARQLYQDDAGRLRAGARSKPKPPKERPRGDRTGFGSSRRLGIALKRLDLTWDTEQMSAHELVTVLPREFERLRTPLRRL